MTKGNTEDKANGFTSLRADVSYSLFPSQERNRCLHAGYFQYKHLNLNVWLSVKRILIRICLPLVTNTLTAEKL